VDDDGDFRQLSTGVLSRFGYEVDAAKDGADAWDTLQLHDYDLVVTDNRMPKVTGVDLLKMLRAAHMGMPVIMVSGTPPTDELSRNPTLHLAGMLLKPFTAEELLLAVQKVLQASQALRAM
jgi:DNA-binding NtrC family response regulator